MKTSIAAPPVMTGDEIRAAREFSGMPGGWGVPFATRVARVLGLYAQRHGRITITPEPGHFAPKG